MITTLATVTRTASDLVATVAHTYAETVRGAVGIVSAPPRFVVRIVTEHPRPAVAALVALAALVIVAGAVARRRAVADYGRRDECTACGAHIADPHGLGCPLDDDAPDASADAVAEALAELAAGRRDQVAAMLAETPARTAVADLDAVTRDLIERTARRLG